MKAILFLTITLLAGCMTPAYYKDPSSGKIAECKASTSVMMGTVGRSEIASCSEAYERMGWKKQ